MKLCTFSWNEREEIGKTFPLNYKTQKSHVTRYGYARGSSIRIIGSIVESFYCRIANISHRNGYIEEQTRFGLCFKSQMCVLHISCLHCILFNMLPAILRKHAVHICTQCTQNAFFSCFCLWLCLSYIIWFSITFSTHTFGVQCSQVHSNLCVF